MIVLLDNGSSCFYDENVYQKLTEIYLAKYEQIDLTNAEKL